MPSIIALLFLSSQAQEFFKVEDMYLKTQAVEDLARFNVRFEDFPKERLSDFYFIIGLDATWKDPFKKDAISCMYSGVPDKQKENDANRYFTCYDLFYSTDLNEVYKGEVQNLQNVKTSF